MEKVFEICMYVLHTVCNLPYDNVVFEICLSLRPKVSSLRVLKDSSCQYRKCLVAPSIMDLRP
jgi:hypothetical protein